MLFQCSLPNFGPGALSTRNEVSLYGTDKEKTLFRPQESSWQDLGQECAEAGVGVHMFLFPTQYVDIASIGTSACSCPLMLMTNALCYRGCGLSDWGRHILSSSLCI